MTPAEQRVVVLARKAADLADRTDQAVADRDQAIIDLYETVRSYRIIGDLAGLSHQTIANIINREVGK